MAQIQFQPPEHFNFRQPEEWPKWRKRFEQFRCASGLDEASDARQLNTLLYCLGEEAETVLNSTNITKENREKYTTVLETFDSFFKVRKNVIFERARFNRRRQQEGETAEQYILELYKLSEGCEYGDKTDEMIRDRLVVGIKDEHLSERLQLDAALTLDKAKKIVRQSEAVHEQQSELKSGQEQKTINEMHSKSQYKHYQTRSRRIKAPVGRQDGRKESERCSRCGREKHSKDKCPAKEATCHRCKKKGHYSTQCRTKNISEVELESERSIQLDGAFLDMVTKTDNETVWTVTLRVNGTEVIFKIDTGAEVTAISENTYELLGRPKVTKPEKILYGPSKQSLQVIGKFKGTIDYQTKELIQPIFVVKGLHNNLLGLPAIKALRLIARLCSTSYTKSMIKEKYPELFTGLGKLGDDYEIKLRPDAKPHALYTPRKVPLPLRNKVKTELEKMEQLGIISKIENPTEWCAGLVVVPKKSGEIRICVDLRPLNESVLREAHPLPKVDDILAQLQGARIFSKLDANSGFWQIPLAEQSRQLTTFITPFGRYCFNKLPFGISSAPEQFQRRMSCILTGLEGVVCLIDDVLVSGRDETEHNSRLEAALNRLKEKGVTLNYEKCEFSKTKLMFLGHLLDENGIQPSPDKTRAIVQMDPPTNITELRRFLGMVNHLGKFSKDLAQLTQPLRELLSTRNIWKWGQAQEEAFNLVKEELTKPTILAQYDPTAETKISADASSYGIGAMLMQKQESQWKPIVYASRAMSITEQHYAQIEKEALATTWACEHFANYIIGTKILIETDHKPLIPLLSTKALDSLPPRILRFRLRLARFNYNIVHIPGKLMYTADTLSRAPIRSVEEIDSIQDEIEETVKAEIENLPAGEERLNEYSTAQAADQVCTKIMKYCREGWPDKRKLEPNITPYGNSRGSLTISNNLLMYERRIVVPKCLQRETIEKIHQGHQGVEKCLFRAGISVWWPGITNEIKNKVKQCSECAKTLTMRREPLIPTELPDRPWQKIASDLFVLDGRNYLLVVDYFSRYPEVVQLSSTTATSVILALKGLFARHGIPEVVVSDNGPQYTSSEFQQFRITYEFRHTTSSPYYPQSNGQAERMVKTVKNLMKKAKDPFLSLLAYRTTPLTWCNISPAELLMGRRLRTNLPQASQLLVPTWPNLEKFREQDKEYKANQKRNYDCHFGTRPLRELPDDMDAWVSTGGNQIPGQIRSSAGTPRSYEVETSGGTIRRNRLHIRPRPGNSEPTEEPMDVTTRVMTRSRTGTVIRPPDRLNPCPEKGRCNM